MPCNVLPLCLKQTFPLIIWIFTDDEGDTIESRLPFKIFSTLPMAWICIRIHVVLHLLGFLNSEKNVFLEE